MNSAPFPAATLGPAPAFASQAMQDTTAIAHVPSTDSAGTAEKSAPVKMTLSAIPSTENANVLRDSKGNCKLIF